MYRDNLLVIAKAKAKDCVAKATEVLGHRECIPQRYSGLDQEPVLEVEHTWTAKQSFSRKWIEHKTDPGLS